MSADNPQCRNCLKRFPTVMWCLKCRKAAYCSSQCMADDRQMHSVLCFTMVDPKATVEPPKAPPPLVPVDTKETELPIRVLCTATSATEKSMGAVAYDAKLNTPAAATPTIETVGCFRCGKRCEPFTTLTDAAAREFCTMECRVLENRTLPYTCGRCFKPCGVGYVDLYQPKYYCSESCRYPASAATAAIATGPSYFNTATATEQSYSTATAVATASGLGDLPGEVVYSFDAATTTKEISMILTKRIRHDVDHMMRLHHHDASMRQVIAESLYPTSRKLALLEQANEQLLQRQFPHRLGLVCKLHDRHLSYGKPCLDCVGQAFVELQMCPTHNEPVARGKPCKHCINDMNVDQKK